MVHIFENKSKQKNQKQEKRTEVFFEDRQVIYASRQIIREQKQNKKQEDNR